MENKILFGSEPEQTQTLVVKPENDRPVMPNLFPGKTDAETGNAVFPDWDILPPNQFINPRMRT